MKGERKGMTKASKLTKIMAPALAIALCWQIPASYAESLDELKEQQRQVESKKSDLNSSITEKNTEINATSSKIDSLTAKIEELSKKITATNGKITETNKAIAITAEEIAALKVSIDELKKKIKERDALLAERARAIQAGEKVSYVDVVLGADSFTDLIDRFTAVNTIIDADRDIIKEQREDKAKLEAQKVELEEKKVKQENYKAELEALKRDLDAQKAENNALIDELEAEQDRLYKEKAMLQSEYSEALTLESDIEAAIIAEQARIAEEARKAAAAAAAKAAAEKAAAEKAAAARAAQQKSSSTTTTVQAPPSAEASAPAVAEGTWVRPAAGRFTSGFGWRDIGAGPEFHYGIDIANPVGTSVVASHAGTITYVGTMGGYGKVMMMQHVIDGETYSSVYAHLNSFTASIGQTVATGQEIGKMGNTGRSTGPHLHFEIHIGPWRGQEAGVVNPLRYISL